MGMGCRCVCVQVQVHECAVCQQDVVDGDAGVQLREALVGKNNPVALFAALVSAGCCPLCGMVCVDEGQTPDRVVARYVRHLERGQKRKKAART